MISDTYTWEDIVCLKCTMFDILTPYEIFIVCLKGLGWSGFDIAEQLCANKCTVNLQIRVAIDKLRRAVDDKNN